MKQYIPEFKQYWSLNYSHVEMIYTDDEIEDWLRRFEPSLSTAVSVAVDWVISQGLGEVQE